MKFNRNKMTKAESEKLADLQERVRLMKGQLGTVHHQNLENYQKYLKAKYASKKKGAAEEEAPQPKKGAAEEEAPQPKQNEVKKDDE